MKFIFCVLLFALVFNHVEVHASPVKTPDCASRKRLVAPANSAGVFWNKDCKIAYVLPPVIGKLKISQIRGNQSLDIYCPLLDTVAIRVKTMRDKVLRLSEELERTDREESQTEDEIDDGFFGGGFSGISVARGMRQNRNLSLSPMDEQQKILDILADINKLTKNFENIEGATGKFILSTDFSTLLLEYQRLNPRVVFHRLPLKDSLLSITSRSSGPIQLRSVLSLDIAGGKTISTGNTYRGTAGSETQMAFNGALSGKIKLSLFGACPLYNPSTRRVRRSFHRRELAEHVNANVKYSYELAAYRKYSAKYNLGKLAQRIKEQTSAGGFFSTKTINSLVETNSNNGWFDLTLDASDSRLSYDLVASELKAELIDQLFQNVVISKFGEGLAEINLIRPGQNGASTAADEFQKCGHVYCQTAAAVLRVSSAIGGSEQALDRYIKSENFIQTETVKETRMLSFSGTMSFE